MKGLLLTSISLVILSGCQDGKVVYEATDKKGNSIHIPTDNHKVPIIKTCCHCNM